MKKWGYIFGLLTFLVGFLGAILALSLSPTYQFWVKSMSILGHKSGGMYLRIGFILTGIFSFPFIIYLGRLMKIEGNKDYLRKIAIGFGVFSSACTSLAGIFSGVNDFISSLHGFFAMCTWLGGTVTCLSFGILMLRSPKFTKLMGYMSLIIGGIFIYFLIPFFLTNFCNYFVDICYQFGRVVYRVMPTSEWLIYSSTLFWYLSTSIYLFRKEI